MSTVLPCPKISILRSVLGTMGALACHLACVVLMFACMRLIIEVPCQFFRQYGMQLPSATQFMINVAEISVKYWFLALLALPLDALIYFSLSRLPSELNWLATFWLLLTPLAMVCLLTFAMIATWAPLRSIHGL